MEVSRNDVVGTELKKITQIFAMLSFLAFGYNGNIENQIHVKKYFKT